MATTKNRDELLLNDWSEATQEEKLPLAERAGVILGFVALSWGLVAAVVLFIVNS